MPARVLVVDDVPANVKLLAAKLQAEYYEVLTALDGPRALEIVRTQAPDIVLLDVMMPVMDGFEVCRRIKADPVSAHVPVVMITALSDVKDRVKGLEAGADDFLTKPPNSVSLLARIRSLVRLKRAVDEWHTREAAAEAFGAIWGNGPGVEPVAASRVLLAEDAHRGGNKTPQLLRAAGQYVAEARNAADVRELVAAEEFDLILVDHLFGGEDGLRLCSWLRSYERTRHVPILLQIEDGDYDRLAKALDLGVNDYLIKPPDRDELIARSRTQLRRKVFEDGLRANYHRNLAAAITDSLTGLYNRRYLETHFEIVDRRLRDSGKPISLLIIDIDRFKTINDEHGHPTGDRVLKSVASHICDRLRNFDTAARIGGEEFVVLMPESRPEEAKSAGVRLSRSIDAATFPIDEERDLSLTVSIGVASATAGTLTLEALLAQADAALYEAKRAGRNRVHAAGDPTDDDKTARRAAG
jgi:two-component system cell cycle response regulator